MRSVLAAAGYRAEAVAELGEGADHRAYLVDDELVVLLRKVEPELVEREARVLHAVASVSPLPVPAPVFVVPEEGCLAYRALPGTPLLDVPRFGRAVAPSLGRFLAALHGAPSLSALVEHVLIDAGTVAGVIDRSDAAVVDPAYDFGLVLRDLGRGGFEAALAAYSRPVAGLRERAWFYARCAVLEDLAFDLGPRRVSAAAWLFAAPDGR